MSKPEKLFFVRQSFRVTVDAPVYATTKKEAIELAMNGEADFADERQDWSPSTFKVIDWQTGYER